MTASVKLYRVELYHQTEGLICIFPFDTLENCQQFFEELLRQEPGSVYHIHIRDDKEELLQSHPPHK